MLVFLFSGVSKFVMTAEEMAGPVALPLWFLRFIGAELGGGPGPRPARCHRHQAGPYEAGRAGADGHHDRRHGDHADG